MTTEYRNRFTTKEAVSEYVALYSDECSYPGLLYSIEKSFLTDAVQRHLTPQQRTRYLDFAVGTGRIITHLEGLFEQSEGVDISEQMIAISSRRVRRAVLRRADITTEPITQKSYDTISAFRFFLNAESDLRSAILEALVPGLKSGSGIMIVNNHGRILSVKMVSWMMACLGRLLGRPSKQVFMSDDEFQELIRSQKLTVLEEFGYGLLGGRIAALVGRTASTRIERWAAGTNLARLFGTCRIYILQRPSESDVVDGRSPDQPSQ